MFDEEQHILRYWEREFECLNPSKNRAGNRVYTDKDIKVLKVVKKLLRVDRMPVIAAKNLLKDGIPDSLLQEAEDQVKIVAQEPSVQIEHSPDLETEQSDFVQIRRSDVEMVIKLLHEVADQIEAL